MTRSEMDYLDSALLGPALLFLNQYFNNFFKEYYVLWICLVISFNSNYWIDVTAYFLKIWAAFDLTRYCTSVCKEICKSLNIELFRINPRVAVPVGAASGAAEFANGSRNGRHRRQ